jgi:sugar phosphate isomerase/epimerase
MFDLGFVSAIFPEKTFEEVIDFASENNFQCVEIMCWPKGKAERRYAGVTHIDVDNLDRTNVQYIKDYLTKKNVYISALGYYPNPMDADLEKREIYIEHIKRVISAAKLLEIPIVNTFIGRNQLSTLDENYDLFSKIWPPIIKHAEAENIKIGIENCPMFFTNDEWPNGKNMAISPKIWKKLFELSCSTSLGLNYDPSHMVWQQMDYILPLHNFKDRIFHVHLKDAKVDKEKLNEVGILATPLEYHTPKLPGRGDIDWANFIVELELSGYKGPIVIEFEDKDFEKLEDEVVVGLKTTHKFISQYL